jgi:hypothetical protein
VAEIIRVLTDLVPVETENRELVVAGVAVEAAVAVEVMVEATVEVILIVSQQTSPVMHR